MGSETKRGAARRETSWVSSRAMDSNTSLQTPRRVWRKRRIVGYQGRNLVLFGQPSPFRVALERDPNGNSESPREMGDRSVASDDQIEAGHRRRGFGAAAALMLTGILAELGEVQIAARIWPPWRPRRPRRHRFYPRKQRMRRDGGGRLANRPLFRQCAACCGVDLIATV